MDLKKNARGFEVLTHPSYATEPEEQTRLLQQSSVIGLYDDAFDRPGTSALWVGEHHHLTREEVAQLVAHLQAWLATGSLSQ